MMLADQIAQTALHHYQQNLPGKGKPREDSEWTVYAAIVAVRRSDHDVGVDGSCSDNRSKDGIPNFGRRAWVVSCATGTKCCALHQQNNKSISSGAGLSILHDSHAEVLARRGLQRALWEEVIANLQTIQKKQINNNNTQTTNFQSSRRLLVEATPPRTTSQSDDQDFSQETMFFQLDPNIDLHMYISDSPCGDASIYTLQPSFLTGHDCSTDLGEPSSNDKRRQKQQQFTGAKVIVSSDTNLTVQDCGGAILETTTEFSATSHPSTNSAAVVQLVREPEQQLTGKLRTKSGRSNLNPNHRSWSMSCSDKLVRYSVLGWEGTLLASQIVHPIRISSIVVGSDPRALPPEEHGGNTSTDTAASVPQIDALQRAIPHRVQAVRETLLEHSRDDNKNTVEVPQQNQLATFAQEMQIPVVWVSQYTFPRGKSSVLIPSTPGTVTSGNKRKRTNDRKSDATNNKSSKAPSPCGLSLNWHQRVTVDPSDGHDGVELVVGARGIRHGKKPQSSADFVGLQSRLCRNSLMELACQALSPPLSGATTSVVETSEKEPSRRNINDGSNNERVALTTETANIYGAMKKKHGCTIYLDVKKIILKQGPLAGWLIGDS